MYGLLVEHLHHCNRAYGIVPATVEYTTCESLYNVIANEDFDASSINEKYKHFL